MEHLIELVRERPFLYNPQEAGYKDSTLQKNAWAAIAKDVGLPRGKYLHHWAKDSAT